MAKKGKRFSIISFFVIAAFLLSGCGPTYPKEKLKGLLVKLCQDEYGIDVKVEERGGTLYIFMPQEHLLDYRMGILPDAEDKLNNVLLSASRVALSTDADFKFFCIIVQDTAVPEIELVFVRYVEDMKRYLFGDISRGEYFDRMIIDIKLTPQAQKEKAIRDVFKTMKLDDKWAQSVINDYFSRNPVTSIKDVGYWLDKFFVKEISLPEFLAEQIKQRINIKYKKNLQDTLGLRLITVTYLEEGQGHFEITVEAAPQSYTMEDLSPVNIKACLEEAAKVIYDYKFERFTVVRIFDKHFDKYIVAGRKEITDFHKNRISFSNFSIMKK